MAEIITVLNQKGGVGKTTISVNLSYGLSQLGKKTLLIDMDPQSHSSVVYCPDIDRSRTVEQLFLNRDHDIANMIQSASIAGKEVANLSIIPASIHLAMSGERVSNAIHKEKLLYRHLQKIKTEFDYILLDCGPSLGTLNINAIYTADHILIPTKYERYALDGIADLFDTIAIVREQSNYKYHILRNSYDARNKVTNRFIEGELEPFSKHLFKIKIRKSESVNQAQINQVPLQVFDATSNAAKDYQALVEEILQDG